MRVTPDGGVSAWAIPTLNARPDAVAPAPDGSFWVTLPNVSRLARVSPDGAIREYRLENAPLGIAVAGDGGVWFGAPGAKKLGRLDPTSGKVSWRALPEAPLAVAAAPDGSIWVALGAGDRLAKVPPKG